MKFQFKKDFYKTKKFYAAIGIWGIFLTCVPWQTTKITNKIILFCYLLTVLLATILEKKQ